MLYKKKKKRRKLFFKKKESYTNQRPFFIALYRIVHNLIYFSGERASNKSGKINTHTHFSLLSIKVNRPAFFFFFSLLPVTLNFTHHGGLSNGV